MIVPDGFEPKAPARSRTVINRDHEHLSERRDVHGDEIGPAAMVALAIPVIGACAVELPATLPHAPALDLSSGDLPVGENRCEIERRSPAKRKQDVDTGLGERL